MQTWFKNNPLVPSHPVRGEGEGLAPCGVGGEEAQHVQRLRAPWDLLHPEELHLNADSFKRSLHKMPQKQAQVARLEEKD